MLALRRITASRVSLRAARAYSTDNTGPTPSGNPEGFHKREKASEDYYIKQHEREQLKKSQEEIHKREAELGDLKERAQKLSQ